MTTNVRFLALAAIPLFCLASGCDALTQDHSAATGEQSADGSTAPSADPTALSPTPPGTALGVPSMPAPSAGTPVAKIPPPAKLSPELEKLFAMGMMRPPVLPSKPIPNDTITEIEFSPPGRSISFKDSDAPDLLAFPNLTVLVLDKSQITDATLPTIAQITALTELSLIKTPITDAGLQQLTGLTQLKKLDLSGTKITDTSLKLISQSFPELEELSMQGTPVTDGGLAQLGSLPKLKMVDARYTHAGAKGADALQKALPECTVSVGQ